MPTLAATFKRRMRSLLEAQSLTQTALSKHLKLDQGQVSKILKFDHKAATVTVQRLESLGVFFGLPPSDLLRSPDAMPVELTPDENEVLGYYRMLSPALKGHMLGFLRGMFTPLKQAKIVQRQNAIIRASLSREIEAKNRRIRA